MPRHLPAAESHKAHQRLQAAVWEGEAEKLFDEIGVAEGWRCVDLGSGPVGILPPLSRRVGPRGLVVGVERDPGLARAAADMARDEALANVRLMRSDALASGLRSSSFDLVHARFLLHLVPPARVVAEMSRLTRPSGWVSLQEPDLRSWRYWPSTPVWMPLLEALERAIALGGDPNVGTRVGELLEAAGLEAVRCREAVMAIGERHPYMRLPLAWAAAQRETVLRERFATEPELDGWLRELERHVARSGVTMTTFTTVQSWGRKPKAG